MISRSAVCGDRSASHGTSVSKRRLAMGFSLRLGREKKTREALSANRAFRSSTVAELRDRPHETVVGGGGLGRRAMSTTVGSRSSALVTIAVLWTGVLVSVLMPTSPALAQKAQKDWDTAWRQANALGLFVRHVSTPPRPLRIIRTAARTRRPCQWRQ